MKRCEFIFLLAFAPSSSAFFRGQFMRNGCYSTICGRTGDGGRGPVDASVRSADCSSFLEGDSTIPLYANACTDRAQYVSACSCLGVTSPATAAATSDFPFTTDEADITSTMKEQETTSTTFMSSTVTETITVDSSEPTSVTNTLSTSGTITTDLPSPSPVACLNTTQAQDMVRKFSLILTNPDRNAANASADVLISDEFFEMSDSINSLIGLPLGNATLPSKAAFQSNIFLSPTISSIYTLDVFNDCRRIAWSWSALGVGNGKQEVRGINLFLVTPDLQQIVLNVVEFNSIAWAVNMGKVLCNATAV